MKKLYDGNLKGLSIEKLTTPFTTDNSLSPTIKWHEDSTFCLVFKGSYLKQKITATCTTPDRIYFYCLWIRYIITKFTLKDCLFGGIKLVKNTGPDKSVYSAMVLDSIRVHFFHFQILIGAKMLFFFFSWYELISAYW